MSTTIVASAPSSSVHEDEIRAAKVAEGAAAAAPFNPRDGLDDKQLKALDELKHNIQPFIEGDAKWKAFCDEMCLCRYLRARSWNVDKAEKMLKATLEWRREYKPDEILSTDPGVESQIRSGHMFQTVVDRFGRPGVYLKVHTKPDPHDREEKLQFMIYSMERSIRRMDASSGVEKMVWLVCCEGYNLKYNGEVGFAKELLSVLQSHYPERLGALVIFDAPFVFRAFWKIIYPFIDKNTQKKVAFLNGKRDPGSQLHNFMSDLFRGELPKVEKYFGGGLETPFDADAYMAQLAEEERREAGSHSGEGRKKKKKKHHKKGKKHEAAAAADGDEGVALEAEHLEGSTEAVVAETPESEASASEGKKKKKKKKKTKKPSDHTGASASE